MNIIQLRKDDEYVDEIIKVKYISAFNLFNYINSNWSLDYKLIRDVYSRKFNILYKYDIMMIFLNTLSGRYYIFYYDNVKHLNVIIHDERNKTIYCNKEDDLDLLFMKIDNDSVIFEILNEKMIDC